MRRLQRDQPDLPERGVRGPVGIVERGLVGIIERELVGLKLGFRGAGWWPLWKFRIFGE